MLLTWPRRMLEKVLLLLARLCGLADVAWGRQLQAKQLWRTERRLAHRLGKCDSKAKRLMLERERNRDLMAELAEE